MATDLSKYDNSWYDPGRGLIIRSLWYVVNVLFFLNPLSVSSWLQVHLLRMFGAKIGKGVRLKPRINIKYPWNLEIDDYVWIGEGAWLDSLGRIKIGSNVCISQGAYLCTGNHDWNDPAFGLIVKPVVIESGVWIGAFSCVMPGVILGANSVITAGSAVSKNTEKNAVYRGNPSIKIKSRAVK